MQVHTLCVIPMTIILKKVLVFTLKLFSICSLYSVLAKEECKIFVKMKSMIALVLLSPKPFHLFYSGAQQQQPCAIILLQHTLASTPKIASLISAVFQGFTLRLLFSTEPFSGSCLELNDFLEYNNSGQKCWGNASEIPLLGYHIYFYHFQI